MYSGIKKLIPKDKITVNDVYDLIDDICDKVCQMLNITLIIGFVFGALCMSIVDRIVGY